MIWRAIQSTADLVINAWIIGGEIKYNKALAKQAWAILPLMTKISKTLRWEATNAGKLKMFDASLDRLIELKNRISTAKTSSPIKQVIYKYVQSDNLAICLEKLTIGVGNDSRFYVNDLCLKDKIIALSGESGCGKSTFLKIVKQIKHSEAWGEGKITYYCKTGNSVDIWMTSQNEKLTPKSTLLELITSKTEFEAKRHENTVKALLAEIKIDNVAENEGARNLASRLNEQVLWESVLSGGQKQKIIFINIIFKVLTLGEPDFIIFDEIFKEMDDASIKTTQKMIKKYISNTNILIIDHHANINNDNFYANQLHFTNNTVILSETEQGCANFIAPESFEWGVNELLGKCELL